jgi:hypothetical protein
MWISGAVVATGFMWFNSLGTYTIGQVGDEPSRSGRASGGCGTAVLRTVVLLVGGAEAVVIVAFVGVLLWGSYPWDDPLGSAIAIGASILAAAVLVLLVVPALIMALMNRWLGLASALLALAPPAAVLVWRAA